MDSLLNQRYKCCSLSQPQAEAADFPGTEGFSSPNKLHWTLIISTDHSGLAQTFKSSLMLRISSVFHMIPSKQNPPVTAHRRVLQDPGTTLLQLVWS